jgi:hypothetical protein
LFPRWATMPEDSSSDLGGYGIDETEDEIESSDGESSDGIEITRRATRASRKGKEVERRRTTRAEAAVSAFERAGSASRPGSQPFVPRCESHSC